MNCPPKETISRYLDGELPPRERREVEEHIRSCEDCRGAVQELESLGRAMRLFSIREEALPVREKRACPQDDAIAAFADGSMSNPKERRRIARHLAGCERCARKAGEAAEAARLSREIEEEGLERVPPALAARAREEFLPGRPVLAGEIAASVKEILKRVKRGLEPDGPGYSYGRGIRACVSEMRVDRMMKARPGEEKEGLRHMEEDTVRYSGRVARKKEPQKDLFAKRKTKRKKKVRRKKRLRKGLDWLFEKEGMQILVRLRGTPAGAIDCRIELTDEAERPLRGVRVALEKDDREPLRSRTGTKGGAAFRGLQPGRYRLVIFHGRKIHVKIDLE